MSPNAPWEEALRDETKKAAWETKFELPLLVSRLCENARFHNRPLSTFKNEKIILVERLASPELIERNLNGRFSEQLKKAPFLETPTPSKGYAWYMQIIPVNFVSFLTQELRLQIRSFDDFVYSLNNQGFLLKKGPRVYQLQTSSCL